MYIFLYIQYLYIFQSKNMNTLNSTNNHQEKTNTRKLAENFDFREMYKLLSRKEMYSEYTEKVSVSDQLVTVLSELKELHEETEKVENKNIEKNNINIRKELSDVLYTLSLSIVSLLKNWLITEEDLKTMIKENAQKLYDRCPMLLTGDKKPLDEERKIWRARKKSHGERFVDKQESF